MSQMTDSERLKELELAIDDFAKATSMPDGPSLAMQRHEPTWEAWKKVCHAIVSEMTKAQPYTEEDFMRAVGIVQRLHGVTGFDAWVDLIAKELAEERNRPRRR